MDDNFLPILVVPAVPIENGLRFLRRDTQLDIDGQTSKIVWQILAYCNGYNTPEQIAKGSNLELQLVKDVLLDLSSIKVIFDSREQFRHFHDISSNPASYTHYLAKEEALQWQSSPHISVKSGEIFEFHADSESLLMKLQNQRRSVRNFASTKLSRDQIGQLCDLGYNLSRHAVPSGGALYPLKLFILTSKDQYDLQAGYYEYDAENNVLVRFANADEEMLNYIFSTSVSIFNSSVQIIITADIFRQPHKYSNLGYRLTLIEVGQVAQNISLAATEMGLVSCELGGALDKPLSQELNLNKNVVPLLSIAIGYESSESLDDESDYLNSLMNEFVGEKRPVMKVRLVTYPESSFFGATAAFNGCQNSLAGATSTSADLAKIKAIVEAYERYTLQNPRVDFIGTSKELCHSWLDPRKYNPFTEEQISRQGLVKFSDNLIVYWTKGKDVNDSEVFVPSDLVYYGYKSELPRIAWSNSSGVAAYTNTSIAFEKAIFELIERDALMRNWFSRISPLKVPRGLLNVHLQKRLSYWRKQGYDMHILVMPSEFAIVIQVVFTSGKYPCFVSGAAASFSFDEAVKKAYEEAEYSLVSKINYSNEEILDPNKVYLPNDHGKLYSSSKYITNIEWLWSGNHVDKLPTIKQSIEQLKTVLNPITVDLSNDNSSIKVVRVFSERLVPINFGFGNDYFSHKFIECFNPISLELPHYFA